MLIGVALIASRAHAAGGRPMITDDAALTTARSCQVETWVQHARADTQLWLLPACNPRGPFELSVGAVLDWPQGAREITGTVAQLKTQWLDSKLAQIGFAGGAQRAQGDWNLYYAYVPITRSITANTQLHLNVGWQRDRVAGEDQTTYAAALAHDLSSRFNLFAEVFGSDSAAPVAQTGGAVLFRGGVVQLDGSVGRPVRGTWRDFVYSIGFELYPDALW
jgi:hypothetical protein